MKMKKRLLAIRKQSRIALPKENIWFFNEDSVVNPSSPVGEKKSSRNDRLSIMQDDYSRYSDGYSERNNTKKVSSFVVDWQMSNAF